MFDKHKGCSGEIKDARVADFDFVHNRCYVCGFWGFQCRACKIEIFAPLSDHLKACPLPEGNRHPDFASCMSECPICKEIREKNVKATS